MSTSQSELSLSSTEQLVLETIKSSDGPIDTIDIASIARLDVDDVLSAVQRLLDANLVAKATPEPVHERFATASVA